EAATNTLRLGRVCALHTLRASSRQVSPARNLFEPLQHEKHDRLRSTKRHASRFSLMCLKAGVTQNRCSSYSHAGTKYGHAKASRCVSLTAVVCSSRERERE